VTAGARPSLGLFTYSTLPRGSVVHTSYLAEAMTEAGWDVTVYALDKDGRGFFRPISARLALVPAGPAPASTLELVHQRTAELASYLRRTDHHHDVYHAEDCLTANALLDLWPRERRLPLVRTVHHVERFDDPALAQCQRRSICEASICLAVSETAARDVALAFGVRTLRITNGVALDRFRVVDAGLVAGLRARLEPGPGPVVLAVGGIEERKNTLRLLGAFARIHLARPGARLWILGGATVLDHGAYRNSFAQALGELPAETRAAVRELGVVADEHVPAIFRLAQVLALPSLHEGFGLVALEALAADLPLVAARRPPFTEYLDDRCAELVDPLSEAAIADGITRALATSAARRQAGRRCAESHSWRQVAALHQEHYRRLLAPGRPAAG
jgi:glycosyltransferase-like protein